MIGDTVAPGSSLRATVDGAPGATLRLLTNGGSVLAEDTIDSPAYSENFEVPESSTWVRAEVFYPDGREQRQQLQALCDASQQIYGQGLSDEDNYYCSNRVAMVAMTSPIFFAAADIDPATTLTYDGDSSGRVGKEVTLGATLVDGSGEPLAGRIITLEFRGETYSATTNSFGRAVVPGVKAQGPPGSYPVASTFAGDDTYDPSSDSDPVVISTGRK